MKVLHIHAHHDDFEFVAGGTFEMWRRKLGNGFSGRIIVCTDGQAGHHFRPRAETGAMRIEEQKQAASIGGWEFVQLTDQRGEMFREGCIDVGRNFLAALWKNIRDFEPDYLLCPPLPSDNLAGVHPDHLAVAESVRRIAYMINVPHAFTPEYPADETKSSPCKTPVILNVHDGYMAGANAYDLAVNVEPAFEQIVDMTWCHQSQISEWLPWVDRHNLRKPNNKAEWSDQVRGVIERRNRELGVPSKVAIEYFTVTAWGAVPNAERLIEDFPDLVASSASPSELGKRLQRWVHS